jgi:hypothetical protein
MHNLQHCTALQEKKLNSMRGIAPEEEHPLERDCSLAPSVKVILKRSYTQIYYFLLKPNPYCRKKNLIL